MHCQTLMRTASPTSARSTPANPAVDDDAEWDARIVASIWEQQRHRVDDRIDTIERATRALADAKLNAELRARAERAAHMLAGSVGMFGFNHAATAAGLLEHGFSHPTPARAPELRALLDTIRRDINAGTSNLVPQPRS
jgi:hypothetical protein